MSIDLRPRSSKFLARILFGFHLLCAAVVFFYAPFKPAAIALLLLTIWSWYRAHRLHVLHRGNKAVRRAVWQADGQWLLQGHHGDEQPASLLPSSYLHPRLLILNFRIGGTGQRRNLLLFPDSLDFQTLRRLRSRLRIEAASRGAEELEQV